MAPKSKLNCNFCEKSYTTKQNLLNHMMTHTRSSGSKGDEKSVENHDGSDAGKLNYHFDFTFKRKMRIQ